MGAHQNNHFCKSNIYSGCLYLSSLPLLLIGHAFLGSDSQQLTLRLGRASQQYRAAWKRKREGREKRTASMKAFRHDY